MARATRIYRANVITRTQNGRTYTTWNLPDDFLVDKNMVIEARNLSPRDSTVVLHITADTADHTNILEAREELTRA